MYKLVFFSKASKISNLFWKKPNFEKQLIPFPETHLFFHRAEAVARRYAEPGLRLVQQHVTWDTRRHPRPLRLNPGSRDKLLGSPQRASVDLVDNSNITSGSEDTGETKSNKLNLCYIVLILSLSLMSSLRNLTPVFSYLPAPSSLSDRTEEAVGSHTEDPQISLQAKQLKKPKEEREVKIVIPREKKWKSIKRNFDN